MEIRGVRETGQSRVASNLWHYGSKTLKIILRTYLDYWPIRFFGWISAPFLVAGFSLLCFLVGYRLMAGKFTPHIWAGFTGTALFAFGFIVLIAGLLGQMLQRIRLNQEMLLYYQRRSTYRQGESEEKP